MGSCLKRPLDLNREINFQISFDPGPTLKEAKLPLRMQRLKDLIRFRRVREPGVVSAHRHGISLLRHFQLSQLSKATPRQRRPSSWCH